MCQSPFVNCSLFKHEGLRWWRLGVILYVAAPQDSLHAFIELSDWTGPSISAVAVIYRSNGVLSCPVMSVPLIGMILWTKAMVHNETVYSLLWPCSWCYRRCRSSAYLNLGLHPLLILHLSLICLQIRYPQIFMM